MLNQKHAMSGILRRLRCPEKTDNYQANAGVAPVSSRETKESMVSGEINSRREASCVPVATPAMAASIRRCSRKLERVFKHVRGNNLSVEMRSKWNNTRGALMIVGRGLRITCCSCIRIMGNFDEEIKADRGKRSRLCERTNSPGHLYWFLFALHLKPGRFFVIIVFDFRPIRDNTFIVCVASYTSIFENFKSRSIVKFY